MDTQRYDIVMRKGDTFKKKFEVELGTDFTSGYTAQAQFRNHVYDETYILELTNTSGIVLNSDGTIEITLTPAQSNLFPEYLSAFDVKITNTNDQTVSTAVWGNVRMIPSVTRP